MDQEKIGKFILNCRKDLKLTQQELAEKLGVTDKAISKWENGRCLMDISLLKPLSEILNVSIVELINGEKIEKEEVYMKSDEVVENTLNYANSKIKKNKIKIVSIMFLSIISIIILLFLIIKSITLVKYYVEPVENQEQIAQILSLDETMTIYKKTINENDYLIEEDVKIRNDFKKFTKTDKKGDFDSTKYLLYNEEGKLEAGFWIGVMDSYINIFTSDSLTIFNGKDIGQFNDADRKYFLLRNDINNDVDFLKYIKENYYAKNTLFTSLRRVKENYAVNTFVSVALPSINSTTVISGDYSGYIFNLKNDMREVHILRNDKSYVLMFIGEDYTTDKYIKEILSTLEIK